MYDKATTDKTFQIGDKVLIYSPYPQTHMRTTKLQLPYSGPYTVEKCHDKAYYVTKESGGRGFWVNVDRMLSYTDPNSIQDQTFQGPLVTPNKTMAGYATPTTTAVIPQQSIAYQPPFGQQPRQSNFRSQAPYSGPSPRPRFPFTSTQTTLQGPASSTLAPTTGKPGNALQRLAKNLSAGIKSNFGTPRTPQTLKTPQTPDATPNTSVDDTIVQFSDLEKTQENNQTTTPPDTPTEQTPRYNLRSRSVYNQLLT